MFAIIKSKILCLPASYKKKLKTEIYKTNFACCAVWVRNLVSHFEGGTQTEDFWEQRVEEDILT
jgi:hypothetical protein